MILVKQKNKENSIELKENSGIPYLSYPILEKTGLVHHGFSTRMGGVSQGDFSTMNFSVSRGDSEEAVLENYRRIAKAMELNFDGLVASSQTHTTNIRKVTGEDALKGILKEQDYDDIDGLMTDEKGVALVTLYADCVPLYFLDPVHKAIALSHSGWKGTVGNMAGITIGAMAEEYGTRPEDLLVCIGPSICVDCYEIGEDTASEFKKAFSIEDQKEILIPKEGGKYQLDLWKANRILLLKAGIQEEHLKVTNICTCCNPKLLFSHRASKGKRGNLAAFLQLKE